MKRTIIRFSPHELELSDETIIKCENGEFDYDVVRKIIEYGEEEENDADNA